jgi:hypothetical protein
VETGKTLQLTANVSCDGCSKTVKWSITTPGGGDPANGTVDDNGLYTAPILYAPPSGSVTVSATLVADGTTTGSASISVTQEPIPTLLAHDDGSAGYASDIYVLDMNEPANSWDITAGETPAQKLFPAISPDKKTVVYVSDNSTGQTVYASSVEGGTQTLVASWPNDATDFSPTGIDSDGNKIVITYTENNGVCGVETFSMDGSNVHPIGATEIPCSGTFIFGPPRSPKLMNSGEIIYSVGNAITVISADGTTLSSVGSGADVSLSPNQDYIVDDNTLPGEAPGVYTMPVAGGTPVLVASNAGAPTWCPDGTIVFENLQSGTLFAVAVDQIGKPTGKATELSSEPANDPYCR